jgi:hypothetical protein
VGGPLPLRVLPFLAGGIRSCCIGCKPSFLHRSFDSILGALVRCRHAGRVDVKSGGAKSIDLLRTAIQKRGFDLTRATIKSWREIAHPFDRGAIKPLDERNDQIDRSVKIASIHNSVVRVCVADRYDDIHDGYPAIRGLNSG